MDEVLKQKLAENGADVEGAVRRFMGNEALYTKFLGKFKDDTSYEDLIANLERENFEEAFKCAHTLKGVCANLGLDPISRIASNLTELLRGKEESEIDKEQVALEKQSLVEKYRIFAAIITEGI